MIEAWFDKIAKVERQSESSDAQGIVESTWTVVFSSLACHKQRLSASESFRGRAQREQYTDRMFCNVVDVRASDRVTIDSNAYDVRRVDNIANRFLQVDMEFTEGLTGG